MNDILNILNLNSLLNREYVTTCVTLKKIADIGVVLVIYHTLAIIKVLFSKASIIISGIPEA